MTETPEETPAEVPGQEALPTEDTPEEGDGSEGETLVDPGAAEGAPEVDEDEVG